MFSRRDFLTASVALATIFGPGMQGRWSRAAAQQALRAIDTRFPRSPGPSETAIYNDAIALELTGRFRRRSGSKGSFCTHDD